jgi:hypothetical protein
LMKPPLKLVGTHQQETTPPRRPTGLANSPMRCGSSSTRATMTDLGREPGITRQAVHDLLKRAERTEGV